MSTNLIVIVRFVLITSVFALVVNSVISCSFFLLFLSFSHFFLNVNPKSRSNNGLVTDRQSVHRTGCSAELLLVHPTEESRFAVDKLN